MGQHYIQHRQEQASREKEGSGKWCKQKAGIVHHGLCRFSQGRHNQVCCKATSWAEAGALYRNVGGCCHGCIEPQKKRGNNVCSVCMYGNHLFLLKTKFVCN